MSREIFRIAFLLTSLNDLDIFTCDIGNTHLNSKCRDKLWTEAGTEFGTEKGTLTIIERVLYELKISGAAWRVKLPENLMLIGYKSTEVDADVWAERDFNPNGDPYYKYMICYFDDLLQIGFNPKEEMYELNMIYQLKEGFGPPD